MLKDRLTLLEGKCATIPYDEKLRIQAITNIVKDLLPIPNKHPSINRDHEYKRQGAVSVHSAAELLTDNTIPLLKD